MEVSRGDTDEERHTRFESLASALYLITGKSDNNSKCQFPLYLRNVANWEEMPYVQRTANGKTFYERSVPRTLKAEQYMRVAAHMNDEDVQERLLEKFVSFLLQDKDHVSQLWSVGRSYCALREYDKKRDLLTPIVIFMARSSGSHRRKWSKRLFVWHLSYKWTGVHPRSFLVTSSGSAEKGSS